MLSRVRLFATQWTAALQASFVSLASLSTMHLTDKLANVYYLLASWLQTSYLMFQERQVLQFDCSHTNYLKKKKNQSTFFRGT